VCLPCRPLHPKGARDGAASQKHACGRTCPSMLIWIPWSCAATAAGGGGGGGSTKMWMSLGGAAGSRGGGGGGGKGESFTVILRWRTGCGGDGGAAAARRTVDSQVTDTW
jgi:hypothetical protein